jgi:hypothetical protein
MAEIHVSNIRIPIPGLVQRIRTGIFTPDLLGEYSYPFTFDNTPEIAIALGLPADPQTNRDFGQSFPADLYVRGNRRYRGKLDIAEANDAQIKGVFVLQSGFFIQDNVERKLRQCYTDADTVVLDPEVEYVGGYRIRCAHGNARMTLNGAVFDMAKADYEDQEEQLYALADWIESLPFLGLTVTVVISAEGHSSASYIEYWDADNPTTATLVQMPNGGTSRIYRATPRQSPRLLMGAFNTPSEANRIAFPQIYHPGLYEAKNPVFDGIVNRYDKQGRLDSYNPSYFAFSDALLWVNTMIPFIYLTDVVKAVFASLNIQVSGEFFTDPMIRKLLLYNNRTLDFLDITQGAVSQRRTPAAVEAGDTNPAQESLIYQNTFDFTIRLANHVPDIGVVDFLKALKNTLFLKYDFNLLQNKVEIRFTRSIIRSREVLDLTAQVERGHNYYHRRIDGLRFSYEHKDPLLENGQNPVPVPDHTVLSFTDLAGLDAALEEYAYVQSLSATFRLVKDRDDPPKWELIAFDLQDDPDREGSLDWPLGMTPLVDAFYEGKKLPAMEGTAHSPEANLRTQNESLRLTAFYGQQADTEGNLYAFASSNRYRANGTLDVEMHDLRVQSPGYTPRWHEVANVLTNPRERKGNVLLSESDLQSLTRTRLIRINNVTYIMNEMELTISDRPHALAEITLYKVKS